MLKSSELDSVLSGVDGEGVEHPEVDNPAEVLWCPFEVVRFIHELWRDARTTTAIFNLSSLATLRGILLNTGTNDIKKAWWPYTSACRSFSWYACSFWILRLSIKIDVNSSADEAMDSSLQPLEMPEPNKEMWLKKSAELYTFTNFPNCGKCGQKTHQNAVPAQYWIWLFQLQEVFLNCSDDSGWC